MVPALEQLSPAEAERLLDTPAYLDAWLDQVGMPWSPAVVKVLADRAAEGAAPARVPDHPRRDDSRALRELLEQATHLPLRLRQVARLTLEEGLSLTACAARLGITRNTVRAHLNRMRALQRMVTARAAAGDEDVREPDSVREPDDFVRESDG